MDIEATRHSINAWLASTSEAAAMSIVKSERCEGNIGEAAFYAPPRQHIPSEDQKPPRMMSTMDIASTRRTIDVSNVKDSLSPSSKLDSSSALRQSGRAPPEAASSGATTHQLLGSDDIEVFFSSLNPPSGSIGASSRLHPGSLASSSPLTMLTNARSAENGAAYNYYQALQQHVSSTPLLAYPSPSHYADYSHSGHLHDGAKSVHNSSIGCYGDATQRIDGYGLSSRPGWTFSPYPSSMSIPALSQYQGEHERPSQGVPYVPSVIGRSPLNGYVAAPPATGGIADHGVWSGVTGAQHADLDEGVIGPGERTQTS